MVSGLTQEYLAGKWGLGGYLRVTHVKHVYSRLMYCRLDISHPYFVRKYMLLHGTLEVRVAITHVYVPDSRS